MFESLIHTLEQLDSLQTFEQVQESESEVLTSLNFDPIYTLDTSEWEDYYNV